MSDWYDDLEPRALSAEESAELKAMWADPAVMVANPDRFKQLQTRALLYGDSTIVPQPFAGLEPRYSTDD